MKYEITIPSQDVVPEIIVLLKKHEITQIEISTQTDGFDKLSYAKDILDELPNIDITMNISCMYHTPDSADRFVEVASDIGITKFLIVSGEDRKSFDSLEALEHFKDRDITICVSYNPFLEGAEHEEEEIRLRKKLEYTNVKAVALQLGTNEELIVKGIELIDSINNAIDIYGAVLIPNDFILKKLKEATWAGVFYDDDFLSNMDMANAVTYDLLGRYSELGVEPILIILPFTYITLAYYLQKR